MLIALKTLLPGQQVWKKKKSLLFLCLYIFVSVGLHCETSVYSFPNSFSKSSISYAKIMYMLSKQCRYQNTFDFPKTALISQNTSDLSLGIIYHPLKTLPQVI